MPSIEEARAQLAVAELESELVAAKADGSIDSAEMRDLKHRLREARQGYRSLRSPEPDPGDADITPETIDATAEVQE